FSSRFKEVRLPLEEIESIRFEKKRWLKIRTYRLSSLAGIPDNYSGEARLGVRKEDREATEEFVALVARRLPYAAQSVSASRDEREDSADNVARWIKGPAWGLIATGIAAFCFWTSDLLKHARNDEPGDFFKLE